MSWREEDGVFEFCLRFAVRVPKVSRFVETLSQIPAGKRKPDEPRRWLELSL